LSSAPPFIRRAGQSFDSIPAPSEKFNDFNAYTSIDFGNHIALKTFRITLKLNPDNADI
jgi:hypothetical protein